MQGLLIDKKKYFELEAGTHVSEVNETDFTLYEAPSLIFDYVTNRSSFPSCLQ